MVSRFKARSLTILGRADEAIGKHREAAGQELKPRGGQFDGGAGVAADLCRPDKA
jgi:hypothetical protein